MKRTKGTKRTKVTADCKTVYRHICENLAVDPESPICREIREHMRGCENCRTYLDTLQKTVTLYRLAPVPRLSSSARRSLHEKITLVARARPRRKR
jgi:predicted anti-sigma-YlaC factor YlaD